MKKKYLLITGGTGGHVIPAQNLANYLNNKKIDCTIIVDKRGYKYINNFKGKIHIINSSNFNGNFILKIIGAFNFFLGFIQSLSIILFLRPNIVISFGSYASFFPMLCCIFLKPFSKSKLFIHEQNSVIGRTNSIFLNFSNKLLLNFDISKKINKKFINKIHIVGSPENTLDLVVKKNEYFNKKFTIFIFGGSQGSEFISNFSTKLIKIIDKENIIDAKFIIQSPNHLIKKISFDLKKIRSQIIIKDYYLNIDEVLNETSIAISRAGAGSIRDLINYKIPSIIIPLPTSKDDHQYNNAIIIEKHNLGIIIDQNTNELIKAKNYIYEIYNNPNKTKLINQAFNKITVKNSNSLIYNLIKNEK